VRQRTFTCPDCGRHHRPGQDRPPQDLLRTLRLPAAREARQGQGGSRRDKSRLHGLPARLQQPAARRARAQTGSGAAGPASHGYNRRAVRPGGREHWPLLKLPQAADSGSTPTPRSAEHDSVGLGAGIPAFRIPLPSPAHASSAAHRSTTSTPRPSSAPRHCTSMWLTEQDRERHNARAKRVAVDSKRRRHTRTPTARPTWSDTTAPAGEPASATRAVRGVLEAVGRRETPRLWPRSSRMRRARKWATRTASGCPSGIWRRS
jgi:hypothetical protein